MENKQLVLLRHATASPQSPGGSDIDRPLSERGMSEARKIGQWMATHLTAPELIISSSATRARETIEQVCGVAGWNRDLVTLTRSMYLADPLTIHKTITEYLKDRERIMIVGHNPGLEEVFRDYYPGAASSQNQTLMGVGATAVISLSSPISRLSKQWEAKIEQWLQVDELD